MNKKAIVGMLVGGVLVGTALVVYIGKPTTETIEVEIGAPEAQAAEGDQVITVAAKQDQGGTVTALVEVKEKLPADKLIRSERITRQQIVDRIAAKAAGIADCKVRFDSCVATYTGEQTVEEAVLIKFDAAVVEAAPIEPE